MFLNISEVLKFLNLTCRVDLSHEEETQDSNTKLR